MYRFFTAFDDISLRFWKQPLDRPHRPSLKRDHFRYRSFNATANPQGRAFCDRLQPLFVQSRPTEMAIPQRTSSALTSGTRGDKDTHLSQRSRQSLHSRQLHGGRVDYSYPSPNRRLPARHHTAQARFATAVTNN